MNNGEYNSEITKLQNMQLLQMKPDIYYCPNVIKLHFQWQSDGSHFNYQVSWLYCQRQ